MATYDIEKITLPDNDVCKIVDDSKIPASDYNYIVDSHPYSYGVRKGPNAWYYVQSPSGSVSNLSLGLTSELSATIAANARFQFLKHDYLNGVHFGGMDFSDFRDGDPAMVSFEYISDQAIQTNGVLGVKINGGSFINNRTAGVEGMTSVAASSTWKRLWFYGEIPSGWDTIMQTPYTCDLVLDFQTSAITNLRVRRVSLTKSKTESQWLPNPQDIPGDFNRYNYLVNSLPNKWVGTWSMGAIAQYYDDNCSVTFSQGYVTSTCTSYDLSIGSRTQIQFAQQYNSNVTSGKLCSLIWSGWRDGDPFTCSVEVKSDTDFYVEAIPHCRSTSSSDHLQPWEPGEKKVLVKGDGKWHRVWISGVIPDGFMAVAQDYSSYVSMVRFYFYFTAAQTIYSRKFMMNKGLQREDWVPGMMDQPGRIFYYDETSGTNYTSTSYGYVGITKPSVLNHSSIKIVSVAALYWSTNSAGFGLVAYPENSSFGAYIIAPSGTTVNGLKIRWYYTYTDVSGYEVP